MTNCADYVSDDKGISELWMNVKGTFIADMIFIFSSDHTGYSELSTFHFSQANIAPIRPTTCSKLQGQRSILNNRKSHDVHRISYVETKTHVNSLCSQ